MPDAPADAQYLTLAANGVLTDYRILAVGSMLVAVDGGPAGTYQLNVEPSNIDHGALDDLSANDHPQYMLGTILSANGDILIRAGGSPSPLPIGNTGDVLTVAAAAPTWAQPAAQAQNPAVLPFTSGRYYSDPYPAVATTTKTLAANTLYLVPLAVPRSTTFNQIAVEVTTNAAGNARLGIYGPFTGSWASLPLVTDAGTVSVSSNGAKTITINQTLAPGWYFLALVTDVTPSVRALATASTLAQHGKQAMDSASPENATLYTFTYGTLPSPSTTTPSFNTTTVPFIALRAA